MDGIVRKAGVLPALEETGAADRLAARSLLYAVFQTVFGSAPSKERFSLIDRELTACALRISEVPEPEKLIDAVDAGTSNLELAKSAYVKLFEGPGKLAAPPWESAYRSASRALFQAETLEVRSVYRRNGFLPCGYPRVADDHIALELDFLGAMARRMEAAFEASDWTACADAARESRDFLAAHLMKWVESYAADMQDADEGGLYGDASSALVAFLRRDVTYLGRLVDSDDR